VEAVEKKTKIKNSFSKKEKNRFEAVRAHWTEKSMGMKNTTRGEQNTFQLKI